MAAPSPSSHAPAPTPELSWGQTLSQAGQNLIPSTGQAIGGIWNAVTHPLQTIHNLGQLATGAGSQLAGALGAQQNPAQKARNEAVVRALEQHYGTVYGSVKGFKQGLATDPAGVLMDASMIADPMAGALGKVGEAGKLGVLSDAATAASRVLPYVNPVKSALAIARAPGAAIGAIGRGIGSVTSRVPPSALDLATQVGREGDPIAQAAFTRFATGQGDATEIQQLAQQQLAQIKQQASDSYLARKANLADTTPSFDPIDQSIADARSKIQMGGPQFQAATGQFPQANDAVDKAESIINAYRNSPDPVHTGLFGVDNLKQAVYDLADNYSPGSTANSALMGIYHGVKKSLVDADPQYANMMDAYQEGLKNTKDLTKTLGLGNNAAATMSLGKQLRALKTGPGTNLLQQLTDNSPALKGALAGAAINPWSNSSSLWEAALGAGLPAAFIHPLGAAAALPGAAIMGAASSPRIVGSLANLAGKASRPLDWAAGQTGQNVAKGLYYGSRPNEVEQNQGVPSGPSGPSAPNQTGDPVFDKMLHIESGNRQLHPNGTPIISPKGAVGAAQILPTTGPQAAALAGEAWDPQRLATDQDYNTRLGHAYYQHLSQIFGDPILGAAAYNAGPGRVQEALDRASATGGQWLNYLPAETQAYVKNITESRTSANGGRIQLATGGKAESPSHEQLVQRLMDLAEKAKKDEAKSTKPLLHVPDNTVVKALEIAQQAF